MFLQVYILIKKKYNFVGVLATIGELSLVTGQDMSQYIDHLLPIIIDSLQV